MQQRCCLENFTKKKAANDEKTKRIHVKQASQNKLLNNLFLLEQHYTITLLCESMKKNFHYII